MPQVAPVQQPDKDTGNGARCQMPPETGRGNGRQPMNTRSFIAATLLLASVVSISACGAHATLAAKDTTSHAASTVEAKNTIPNAVYPIEARYDNPGPF